MKVTWSLAAARQLGRIFDYLDELNPKAAEQVSAALAAAGDDLALSPIAADGFREPVFANW